MAEALLTLEPLHREVLVLRFHEELSLEEIAQVTRSPLSTVKSRLYRGLSALKPRIVAGRSCRRGGRRRDESYANRGPGRRRWQMLRVRLPGLDCDADLGWRERPGVRFAMR